MGVQLKRSIWMDFKENSNLGVKSSVVKHSYKSKIKVRIEGVGSGVEHANIWQLN